MSALGRIQSKDLIEIMLSNVQFFTFSYRYGYSYFGLGPVFAISSMTTNDSIKEQINNGVNTQIKFSFAIDSEKRNFDVIIDKSIQETIGNIIVCDLKMNEKDGKAIIVIEDRISEPIVIPPQIESYECTNFVLKIGDEHSKSVTYSGGKGASLSALFELSKSCEIQFIVPRGIIITTNAYKFLLSQNSYFANEMQTFEKIVWYEII